MGWLSHFTDLLKVDGTFRAEPTVLTPLEITLNNAATSKYANGSLQIGNGSGNVKYHQCRGQQFASNVNSNGFFFSSTRRQSWSFSRNVPSAKRNEANTNEAFRVVNIT